MTGFELLKKHLHTHIRVDPGNHEQYIQHSAQVQHHNSSQTVLLSLFPLPGGDATRLTCVRLADEPWAIGDPLVVSTLEELELLLPVAFSPTEVVDLLEKRRDKETSQLAISCKQAQQLGLLQMLQ